MVYLKEKDKTQLIEQTAYELERFGYNEKEIGLFLAGQSGDDMNRKVGKQTLADMRKVYTQIRNKQSAYYKKYGLNEQNILPKLNEYGNNRRFYLGYMKALNWEQNTFDYDKRFVGEGKKILKEHFEKNLEWADEIIRNHANEENNTFMKYSGYNAFEQAELGRFMQVLRAYAGSYDKTFDSAQSIALFETMGRKFEFPEKMFDMLKLSKQGFTTTMAHWARIQMTRDKWIYLGKPYDSLETLAQEWQKEEEKNKKKIEKAMEKEKKKIAKAKKNGTYKSYRQRMKEIEDNLPDDLK